MQAIAAKEGHEHRGKRGKSLVKCLQGRFAAEGIADYYGDKVDQLIGAHTCAGETYLLLDRFQETLMFQNLSKGCSFSHPGWDPWHRFRSNLNGDF